MIKTMKKYNSIKPGQPWYDTEGKRIQAHGGSVLFWEGKFYWYGENKENVTDEKALWHNGVRLYSSEDLYNWHDEGVICKAVPEERSHPLHPCSKMDRPHMIYNDKTEQFVLWMKIMGEDGVQYMVVATSKNIKGPFEIINKKLHPGGMNSGDFELVKREDGRAVLIFDSLHSDMICIELTEDYLDTTVEYSVHFPRKCPPYVREAPAVFKRGDQYYIFTSGTTAKFPNPSEVATFTDFHGEWAELGDPHINDVLHTSFDSQISCVFKYPYAEDLYIAMADRWLVDLAPDRPDFTEIFARNFDPERKNEYKKLDTYAYTAKNTSLADYVWLPVKFIEGKPCLTWLDEWKIEEYI